MKLTIHDVAKIAGVSPSTVSRVLNNSSLVKEETRRIVQDVIKRMGYQTYAPARSLRLRKGHLIGLIVSDLANPFYGPLIKGVDQVTKKHGYRLILTDSDGELETELQSIRLMKDEGCSAVILITADYRLDHLAHSREAGVPLVLASGYVEDPSVPCVAVDNAGAAFQMTTHLLSLGHRRIAVIRGPVRDTVSSLERYKGYRLALQGAGIEVDESLVEEGDFTVASGAAAMTALLRLTERPTAVFAFSDLMALGALQAAKAAGLKVPDDVSIAGFDGLECAALVDPALTTIAQQPLEIGRQSAEIALQLSERKEPARTKILVPHELIVRASTSHSNRNE